MLFGVQLFTVRDFLKPASALANTVRRIKEIGYEGVELFGLQDLGGEEWLKLLEDNGLKAWGVHALWEEINAGLDLYLDNLQKMRCEKLVIALSKEVDFESYDEALRFAEVLDKTGKLCRAKGIKLTYHNHNHEFIPLRGGITGMDILLEQTQPENLGFELDVYQIHMGGAAFLELCEKYSGRLCLLHIKDIRPGSIFLMQDMPMRDTACTHLGNGNFDLSRIFQAAKRAGCEYFIVEQDGNWVDGDPFKALELSFKYLTLLKESIEA
jgi:sugar phosphate isomerase/epimerase